MLKDSDIKVVSEGDVNSFFIKKGYKSQTKNNTITSNRSSNYWDIGRITNSAWDQADCYRYSKEYILSAIDPVLEIGCGTLTKQNKFYFSNGFTKDYYCIDQNESFSIASQLGYIKENVKCIVHDLETSSKDLLDIFSNVKLSNILCFDVIEHLYNPSIMLNVIKQISNESTNIFFSTPERDLKRGLDCMYSNKLEHVREWNEIEFVNMLNFFGFNVKDVQIVNDTDAIENCKKTMIVRCGI